MNRTDETTESEQLGARIRELEEQLAEERARADHVCPHPLATWVKVSLTIAGFAAFASVVDRVVDWIL